MRGINKYFVLFSRMMHMVPFFANNNLNKTFKQKVAGSSLWKNLYIIQAFALSASDVAAAIAICRRIVKTFVAATTVPGAGVLRILWKSWTLAKKGV